MINIKNEEQLAKMRSAGHLLYDVLCALREKMAPGMTTWDLDRVAHELIRKGGATPSFLGYCGYPAALCVSIDDEVVHGIPSRHVTMNEGSIVSVDCGVILAGWQSDSAFTVGMGEISAQRRALIRVTEECFWLGVRQALAGNHVGDISAAVQQHAQAHGYGVIRDLTGHGIGRDMHEEPSVPNFGRAGHGMRLYPGMTLAVEPMIALGNWAVHQLADGWTMVTNDHSPCAHYEHTIAITNGLPEVLSFPGFRWDIAPKGERDA